MPERRHYSTSTARHCHFCDALVQFPHAHKWGGIIIFCKRKCFTAYLEKNRPVLSAIPTDSCVALRAREILDRLVSENLRCHPVSSEAVAREEMIFELTYVLEGHYRITRQERFPPMELKA